MGEPVGLAASERKCLYATGGLLRSADSASGQGARVPQGERTAKRINASLMHFRKREWYSGVIWTFLI
jgi:hypothetical protein